MKNTITCDDLAKQVLARQFNDLLPDIELTNIESGTDISVDALSERVLNPKFNKVTPEIEVKVQELDSGIEVSELTTRDLHVKHLRAWTRTQGLKITIFVFALVSLICNFVVWLIWTFLQRA